RDVLRDGLARGVGRDDHADRRRQVARRAVQVGGDALARDAGHAAQDDLLAERRGLVVDDLLDGLAVRVRGERRVRVARTGVGRGLEHAVREGDERLVLRDEVRLGVELDERRDLAALGVADVDRDEALGGRAALALGDALQTLDADDLERLLRVAVRLVESLLDVEHAGAGALAQGLDVSGGVVRHGGSSLVVRHGYVVTRDVLVGAPLRCPETVGRHGARGGPPPRTPGRHLVSSASASSATTAASAAASSTTSAAASAGSSAATSAAASATPSAAAASMFASAAFSSAASCCSAPARSSRSHSASGSADAPDSASAPERPE